MTEKEFAECFFPIAEFRWNDKEKMKKFARTYFDILKIYDYDIVKEVCHQFSDTWDLFKNFPPPAEFKMRCWQLREERRQESVDRRIGSRPQDIKAQAEFYDTVRKLAEKHGNAAPEGFVTPMHATYLNCVGNLKRMEHYHNMHYKDTEETITE